jgi:hypothetical protein
MAHPADSGRYCAGVHLGGTSGVACFRTGGGRVGRPLAPAFRRGGAGTTVTSPSASRLAGNPRPQPVCGSTLREPTATRLALTQMAVRFAMLRTTAGAVLFVAHGRKVRLTDITQY